MLRQAENKVKIEGILSEIDIKPGSFQKNGQTVESIGGTIKIKVNQKINGEDTVLEIPVHMFASKTTNKGTPNPAYESIKRIADEYVSIAASDEATADRVRITNGSINMNEYYGSNGQLVSFPRINASFISKAKKDEFKPEATFTTELVVLQKDYETKADGTETGRYKILCALSQYGGKVDLVPFFGVSEGVINAVSQYWNVGDTVKANGRLNFSSKTETVITEVDFGEPVENTRTINVSELIVTGGSQTPLDGDFAFNFDEIQKGLTERKARLEAQKEKDMSRTKQKAAPAANSFNPQDLGF